MTKYITHAAAIGLVVFFASLTNLAQTGADTYKAECQMYHGVTGLGDKPAAKAMKARPFNSPDLLKESDAELRKGKNKIPAFAGKAHGRANR
jgi:cytochrome c6